VTAVVMIVIYSEVVIL